MTKVQAFPNCSSLLYYVAVLLHGILKTKKKHIENRKYYEEKIIAMFQQVSNMYDSKISPYAKQMLIMIHLEKKEFQQAKAILHTIPEQGIDKKKMQAKLYHASKQYHEACEVEENRLLSSMNEVQTILLSLLEIAIEEERCEDALYIANVSSQSAKIFDLWQYNQHVAHFEYYSKMKKHKDAVKTFLLLMSSLSKKWELQKSPLYKHIKVKKIDENFGSLMQKKFVKEIKDDKNMQFLTDDSTVQALFDKNIAKSDKKC